MTLLQPIAAPATSALPSSAAGEPLRGSPANTSEASVEPALPHRLQRLTAPGSNAERLRPYRSERVLLPSPRPGAQGFSAPTAGPSARHGEDDAASHHAGGPDSGPAVGGPEHADALSEGSAMGPDPSLPPPPPGSGDLTAPDPADPRWAALYLYARVFEMESLISMLDLGHASTVEQLAAQMVSVDHLRSIFEEPGTRTALALLDGLPAFLPGAGRPLTPMMRELSEAFTTVLDGYAAEIDEMAFDQVTGASTPEARLGVLREWAAEAGIEMSDREFEELKAQHPEVLEGPPTHSPQGELLRIPGLIHLQGDSWRTLSSALTQLRLQLRLRVIEGRAGQKEPVTPQEAFVETGYVPSLDLLQIIGGYSFQDTDMLAIAHQWISEAPQDARAYAAAVSAVARLQPQVRLAYYAACKAQDHPRRDEPKVEWNVERLQDVIDLTYDLQPDLGIAHFRLAQPHRTPVLQLPAPDVLPRLGELLALLTAITQEARATWESLERGEPDHS